MSQDQYRQTRHSYDDMLFLPHHVSPTHPQMSSSERAAQFSPFAALTGHREALKEIERQTVEQAELDEDAKQEINEKLLWIQKNTAQKIEAAITYFQPDEKKSSGAYVRAQSVVEKIQMPDRILVLADGRKIPLEHIIEIESCSCQSCCSPFS